MAVPQSVSDALTTLQGLQDTLVKDQAQLVTAQAAQAVADQAAAQAGITVNSDSVNLGQSVSSFISLVTQTYGPPAQVQPQVK